MIITFIHYSKSHSDIYVIDLAIDEPEEKVLLGQHVHVNFIKDYVVYKIINNLRIQTRLKQSSQPLRFIWTVLLNSLFYHVVVNRPPEEEFL